jgi:hypothetical protein
MKIGGWRTRSVFERYAIISHTDIEDALEKSETSAIVQAKKNGEA